MSMTLDQIEAEALRLPEEERAKLTERLMASLGWEAEVETAWLVEADRRYEELRTGQEVGIPVEEFHARMRALLA